MNQANSLLDHEDALTNSVQSLWEVVIGVFNSVDPLAKEEAQKLELNLDLSQSRITNLGNVESMSYKLLNEPISDEIFELIYDLYIEDVPNDANRKLFIELSFLKILTKFEDSIPAKLYDNKKRNESRFSLICLKGNFYATLVDFSLFLINNKKVALNDLGYILLSEIFKKNSIEFAKHFWDFMESRRLNLLKFVDEQYLNKSVIISYNTKQNKYLIGKRRPGSVLATLLKQLIERAGSLKDNLIHNDPKFVSKLYFYIYENFSINDDLFSTDAFSFNETFLSEYKSIANSPKSEAKFSNFCSIRAWLTNPIASNYVKNPQMIDKLRNLVTKLIEFSSSPNNLYLNKNINYNSPNLIKDEDFKKYLKTKNIDDIKNEFLKEMVNFKLDYWSLDNDVKYSDINPSISNYIFTRQLYDDSKFRFIILFQIFLVLEFFIGLADKNKKTFFDEMLINVKKINSIIDSKNNSIPKIDEPIFTNFENIYPTIDTKFRNSDISNYTNIQKDIKLFFKEKDVKFYSILYQISQISDKAWLNWKFTKFGIFNISLSKLDEFINNEIPKVEKIIKDSLNFEKTFAIKFGNRNITNILNSRISKELILKKIEINEFEIISNDIIEKKLNEGEITFEERNVLIWKNSRFNRHLNWLNIELENIFYKENTNKYVKDPNKELKRRLNSLIEENTELTESIKRKRLEFENLKKNEIIDDKVMIETSTEPNDDDDDISNYY